MMDPVACTGCSGLQMFDRTIRRWVPCRCGRGLNELARDVNEAAKAIFGLPQSQEVRIFSTLRSAGYSSAFIGANWEWILDEARQLGPPIAATERVQ